MASALLGLLRSATVDQRGGRPDRKLPLRSSDRGGGLGETEAAGSSHIAKIPGVDGKGLAGGRPTPMVDPASGMGFVDLQKGAVDADAAALAAHVAFALSSFYGFSDIGGTEETEKGPPGLSGKSAPK